MRISLPFLASVAILSSIAGAEPSRPKFYFPREIKRPLFKNTTRHSVTQESTQDFLTSSSSSTRRSLPDLSDFTGQSSAVTIRSSSDADTTASDASAAESSAQESSAAAPTGAIPVVVVQPTPASSSSNVIDLPTSVPTIGGGITFGPGGILGSSSSSSSDTAATPAPDTSSADTTPSTVAAAETSAPPAEPSLPSIPQLISSIVSALPVIPSTTAAPESVSQDSVPTTTAGITGPGTSGEAASTPPPAPISTPPPPPPPPTPSTTTADPASAVSTVDPVTTDPPSQPSSPPATVTAPVSPVITPPPSDPTSLPPTQDNNATAVATPPTASAILTDAPVTTSLPGVFPPDSLTVNGTAPAGTAPVAAATTTDPAAAVTSAPDSDGSSVAPLTILPTGTDTLTSMWLPTSIIFQASPTVDPGAAPTSTPTGIPPNIPQVISPSTGTPPAPDDSTLIQVGFDFALNYQFVVKNSLSSSQIFKFLPVGIADGLGLREDQVTMQSLLPLDTTAQLGYITTLALAYIPSNMVDTLSLDLHIPTSEIYQNDDSRVKTLLNYINPAIPITPGSTIDAAGVTGTDGSGSASSNPATVNNNGLFNTQVQNSPPAVKGATAGIAVGAVGAAAAYGAAMFFIARRYKKRKQSHRRSSSTLYRPQSMTQSGSPALTGGGAGMFMSGGRSTPGGGHDRNSRGSGRSAGNSARTQQISAPVMAENSLGWN